MYIKRFANAIESANFGVNKCESLQKCIYTLKMNIHNIHRNMHTMHIAGRILNIIRLSAILGMHNNSIYFCIKYFERMIFVSTFKEILPEQIQDNPFKLMGKDWALVTSGTKDSFNTMTVSWGGVGVMWGKPVAFTFIRPQRHTFGFIENNNYFTMSFFYEEYRDALNFCGTKSGRDYDKPKETGLTPAFTEDGIPYFEQARLVLVCKKMYSQFLTEENVIDGEGVKKWYKDDYHKMYVSEITKVLVK